MNKKPVFLVMLVVLLAVGVALVACNNDPAPAPTPTPTPTETRGSIKIDNASNSVLFWAGVFDRDWNQLYDTRNGESILDGDSKTWANILPGWYNVAATDENGNQYRTSNMVEVIAGQTVTVRFNGSSLR